MSGIRTIADLRDRCWVDPDTKCWHWRGAKHKVGVGNRQPVGMAWCPAAQRAVTLGVLISFLRTSKGPAKGQLWYCVCDTRDCANPAHRKLGTQRDVKRSAPDALSHLKAAAVLRARSKVSDEVASEIRCSDEPGIVLAAKYDVSPAYVSRIRTGRRRAPLNNWMLP
jgi:hypothetical protein